MRQVTHNELRWNEWALGIIILEVLIGSDLVLSLESMNDVEEFFRDCHCYMDKLTEALLRYLLFNEAYCSLE